jgi:hypothetical protein
MALESNDLSSCEVEQIKNHHIAHILSYLSIFKFKQIIRILGSLTTQKISDLCYLMLFYFMLSMNRIIFFCEYLFKSGI